VAGTAALGRPGFAGPWVAGAGLGAAPPGAGAEAAPTDVAMQKITAPVAMEEATILICFFIICSPLHVFVPLVPYGITIPHLRENKGEDALKYLRTFWQTKGRPRMAQCLYFRK